MKSPFGISVQKYLIGGTRRHLRNSQVDESWHVPRLTRQAIDLKAEKYSDGSLLISGDFNDIEGKDCRGMVRIKADGSHDDASFSPAIDLRFAKEFKITRNVQIFVLLDQPWSDSERKQFPLVLFSPEGEPERGYFQVGTLQRTPQQTLTQIELLADDSLVVESNSFSRFSSTNSLTRISPSREIDPSWQVYRQGDNPREITMPGGQRLLGLQDGTFYWGMSLFGPDGAIISAITTTSFLSPIHQDEEEAVYFTGPQFTYLLVRIFSKS